MGDFNHFGVAAAIGVVFDRAPHTPPTAPFIYTLFHPNLFLALSSFVFSMGLIRLSTARSY